MQAYDILIAVLLIASTAWGARRGFAKQVATLASLILGYIVAINFRVQVAGMIDAAPPWNSFAAMLILFVGTSLVVWIAARGVSASIEKMGLTNFDTQMGALFGGLKGGLLAMVLTMFAVVMLGQKQQAMVLNSFSGFHICQLINKAHAIVPEEWQQAMGPYFETLAEHGHLVENPPMDSDAVSPIGDLLNSPSDIETTSRYDEPDFAELSSLPETQQPGRREPARIVPNRSSEFRDARWNR